jgi:hypothetical protein
VQLKVELDKDKESEYLFWLVHMVVHSPPNLTPLVPFPYLHLVHRPLVVHYLFPIQARWISFGAQLLLTALKGRSGSTAHAVMGARAFSREKILKYSTLSHNAYNHSV